MAKYLTPPDKLEKTDKRFLRELITATEQVFPADLGLAGGINKSLTDSYTTSDGLYHWTNKDLLLYVTDLTHTENVRAANSVLYKTLTTAPEYMPSTMTKSPEQLAATRPDIETIKTETEKMNVREAKRKEAIESSNEAVRRAIEQKMLNQEELEKLKQSKIKVNPVEPIPTTNLDEKSKEQLFKVSQAVKTDPGIVQEAIKTRLKASIAQSPPEVREQIPETLVDQYVSDFTSRIAPLGIYTNISQMPTTFPNQHPASVTAALAEANNVNFQKFMPNAGARKLLAQEAASLSLGIDAQNQTYRQLASTWMEQGAVDALYPDEVVRYEVSHDQTQSNEDGAEVSAWDVIEQGEDIEKIYSRIHSATDKVKAADEIATQFNSTYTVYPTYTPVSVATPEGLAVAKEASTLLNVVPVVFGATYGFRQGALAAKWAAQGAPLLTSGGFSTPLLTATTGEMVGVASGISSRLIFNTNVGKFSLSVITANKGPAQILVFGAKLGDKAVGGMVAAAGKQIAIGTITGAGKKLAVITAGSKLTGLVSKAITAIGGLTGPQGALIGAAVGFLASKAGPILKKIGKAIVIGFGILAGGLIGLSTGVGAVLGGLAGGLGTAGLVSVTTGGLPALTSSASAFMSGIASGTSFAFHAALAGIGAPILTFLLGFPVLVALILFIVNSGAYIVPPRIADSPFSGIGLAGLEADGLCSREKGPVEGITSPASSSPIANRAYKISYDLYRGFWCFWNRSPSNNPWNGPPRADFPDDKVQYPPNYPNLFDYSAYKSNPMPPSNFQGNLFWCTWLVIKAYNESGTSTPASLFTPSMYNDFKARTKTVDAARVRPGDIKPGSVVFFHVTTGQNRPGYECNCNHVGVVYAADRIGFQFVQSNAPLKSQTATFKSGGGVVPVGGIMEVKYFGLP